MKIFVVAICGFVCSLFLPMFPVVLLEILFYFYLFTGLYGLFVGLIYNWKDKKPKEGILVMISLIMLFHCTILSSSVLRRKLDEAKKNEAGVQLNKVEGENKKD